MSNNVYLARLNGRDTDEKIAAKLDSLANASGVLKVITKDAHAALKIHFGEKDNTGHISASWLKKLTAHVGSLTNNAFFTDTNVLYKESRRTNSADHLKLACDHGFSLENLGLPVIIADGLWGRNYVDIEINKKRFKSVKIAADVVDSDCMIALTHITGHIMTGFAGALKNLGMGCASRRGKFEQHCGIVPDFKAGHCAGCGQCVVNCPAGALVMEGRKVKLNEGSCIGCGECVVVCKTDALTAKWSETLANLQEKMVEYAYGVTVALEKKIAYINFLTNITRDCDCLAKDEPRIVKDIGILASNDPVSIDKASADLLNGAGAKDIFREQYPEIDWAVQLKYAASLGMGNLEYKLIEPDLAGL